MSNNKAVETDITKVSEAFGYLIGKNINSLGVEFDVQSIAKGLQESAEGREAPMSEEDCIQAISLAQETALKKQATENLSKAEIFLKENAKQSGIVSLEEGKLQYKVEKKGKGKIVKEHDTPQINYVGKYLDGSIFGASKDAEAISLDEAETIRGMIKGLVGMREGEKRTLYIHPELAYGTTGYLPPNSLLTFEVELVKASTPKEEEQLTLSPSETQAEERSSEEQAVR